MGKILRAACECGYETSALVGSGREEHGLVFVFPHYCSDCDQVVCADILASQVCCPLCGGSSLTIYGTQRPSNAPKKAWFQTLFGKKTVEVDVPQVVSMDCYNSDTTFEISEQGHFCPGCGQKTLQFEVEALID